MLGNLSIACLLPVRRSDDAAASVIPCTCHFVKLDTPRFLHAHSRTSSFVKPTKTQVTFVASLIAAAGAWLAFDAAPPMRVMVGTTWTGDFVPALYQASAFP